MTWVSKWILAILWLLVLLVRLVVFCALFLTDIYGFAQVPWCQKNTPMMSVLRMNYSHMKENKYISIIMIIYIIWIHLGYWNPAGEEAGKSLTIAFHQFSFEPIPWVMSYESGRSVLAKLIWWLKVSWWNQHLSLTLIAKWVSCGMNRLK